MNRLLAKAHRVAALTAIVGAIVFPALAQAENFNGLDVDLAGVATINGPANLLLTPSQEGGVGAAWLTAPVSTTSAFSTTFSFSLSNVGGFGNADGLALVFHNSGTSALGSGGGSLGIDLPGGSVAAVLQTFWGSYGIVLNTDATGGLFSNSTPMPEDIKLSDMSQISGTETVTYDPVTHKVSQTIDLTFLVANEGSGSFNSSTNATFDLQARFGPTMTVGLSAATGGGFTDQSITSWTLAPVPEPETFAMLLAGLGLMGAVARRKIGRQA